MKKLLKAAAKDDFCRPLIVCGLSTAMRLGDCCLLKWSDVDLASSSPSVTVKTSKTGETVCIPVYERLRGELMAARAAAKKKAVYVWPQQAALYQNGRVLVSRKLRVLFNKAVGKKNVLVERKHGMVDASVFDFHSLRTTWITEALSRGIPIETVKLVSGHKTVEVVTTHYFHPSRDQVRNALSGALPVSLTGGETKPVALLTDGAAGKKAAQGPGELLNKALKALEGMKPENWTKKRDSVAGLILQVQQCLSAAVS
jgi:integrase